jgi:hypothetical protein
MSRKVAATCPCCGYIVFDEPPGSYAICPICFWEDDEVQLRFPTLEGGANQPSLIEAQKNFRKCGACEQRFTSNVRKPKRDERRDIEWRPVDRASDKFEPPFAPNEKFVPYPDDFMTLYYWKENYWRRSSKNSA